MVISLESHRVLHLWRQQPLELRDVLALRQSDAGLVHDAHRDPQVLGQRLAARLPVAAVGWVGLAEVLGVVEDL